MLIFKGKPENGPVQNTTLSESMNRAANGKSLYKYMNKRKFGLLSTFSYDLLTGR